MVIEPLLHSTGAAREGLAAHIEKAPWFIG